MQWLGCLCLAGVAAILLLFCCVLVLRVGGCWLSGVVYCMGFMAGGYMLVLVLLVWFCMLFVLFFWFTWYVCGCCLV